MWKCQRVLYLFLTGPRRFRHWIPLGLAAVAVAAGHPGAAAQAAGGAPHPASEDAHPQRRVSADAELFTRFRAFGFGAEKRPSQMHVIHRTRVNLVLRPSPRLSFHLRGEDAREYVAVGAAPHSNAGELSLAYADLRVGRNWTLRGGRQELSFGDERLVGNDTEWCQIGQRFDAIRLSWKRRRLRVDAFTSSPVAVRRSGWDRPASGIAFHGLYANWTGIGGATVTDAYVFCKARRSGDLPGRRATAGFRHVRRLTRRWQTALELALQWGREGARPVRAWAGHWEASVTLAGNRATPRFVVEYNAASGDDPHTGAVERFDDLYPAGHDAFALPDPVPWSDMQTLGVTAEQVARGWSFAAGARSIWRAPGAPRRHLGWQVSGLAAREITAGWQIVCSYSRLARRAAAYYGGPVYALSGGIRLRLGGR